MIKLTHQLKNRDNVYICDPEDDDDEIDIF